MKEPQNSANEKFRNNVRARREVVERYCPVIDENTVLICHTDGERLITECVNHEKCRASDGCKHARFSAQG